MNPSQTITERPASPSEPSLVRNMLIEIWSTTLGREVTADDNFFEAGGDSLLALVTIEQINQRLGWQTNMGDLLRFQTIAKLSAEKAQPQAANAERALIRMSNPGARTPIVFIHAGGGMVDGYARLVRELGTDRGCYGLQSPLLLEAPGNVPESMEGLAALYADLLQDEFGDDDFHLFGSCGGGAICVELGRIAADRGLNLGKTVVVDGYLELHSTGEAPENELLVDFYDGVLRMSGTTGQFPAVTSQDADVEELMRYAAAAVFGTGMGSDERAEAFCRRVYASFLNAAHALAIYRPEPADVDMLMLLAGDNHTLDEWRSVITGELTVEVLQSEFHGQRLCIEEAPYLAARIIGYLDEE
ncbi:phosphopantetheine-binding protein [Streptosporangium sp. 'caverna']|uniref:thioesterase domain-containing protein n=1 Tax=Streptosporangium sp. 'caverna' TaxID=2202249 RepID=UPI000D7E97B2|nr:phosphopantetheine-binding protein [Streptosporangium sp. 'caverna']AWS40468.1 hypothetical protein DKM19_03070 [Streptosporangium sp. 'caverna']